MTSNSKENSDLFLGNGAGGASALTPPLPPHSGSGSNGDSGGIQPVSIETEMQRSYLDYAMSVIVARALPDLRDGLKPVHRRILYSMKENSYDSDKPYRKSARVVGDVIGKYHPHGDQAIYDAMVRMAQPFSMRLELVDGQGNFGSMDGDRAAAMRYTEVRLTRSAEALLDDIENDTVDFRPNYDESEREPEILPARYPNILVNGAEGIAVGMATRIPPYNLGELIAACLALSRTPDISEDALIALVPGPDFPTGGIISGREGAKQAFSTGRGSVTIRARIDIEERTRNQALIVSEMPFQTNKARTIERIAELARDKIIDSITDIRDESDRHGIRVVLELRRDANPDVVLAQLWKHSPLQTSFPINMVVLDKGMPRLMPMRDILQAFLQFRDEVVTRRSQFLLNRARARAHVMIGLLIAVRHLDEIVALIRNAPDPAHARTELMARSWEVAEILPWIRLVDNPDFPEKQPYRLSEAQARAILDLRLQRLTRLERSRLTEEVESLVKDIKKLSVLLNEPEKRRQLICSELEQIAKQFVTERKTEIIDEEGKIDVAELIEREDMIVTVTHGGYIKRVSLTAYRSQHRGGKGLSGGAMREKDFVTQLFATNTHTELLFFSSLGMAYQLTVWTLPLGSRQMRGKALVNLLPLKSGEHITAIMALPEGGSERAQKSIIFATRKGRVRRNDLADFSGVRRSGKRAMKLDADDALIAAAICNEQNNILLATRNGQACRFSVEELRVFRSNSSSGVAGIRLSSRDELVSLSILDHMDNSDLALRDLYLRGSALARRQSSASEPLDPQEQALLSEWRASAECQELAKKEQFLLAVTDKGFGKRSSAYEYRITRRSAKGLTNISTGKHNSRVVASFPVQNDDQIMLVTDKGQTIRLPVNQIRIAGRSTQGVTLFRVGNHEKVVSVARLERDIDNAQKTNPAS